MVKDKREQYITDNLALVHSVANRFRGRGAEYDDLYQAGCLGLIKAVDGFDASLGYQFSTYAVPVIMGEIKRLFRDGGAIKISRSLKEKSQLICKIIDEYYNKYNKEPTLSELAELSSFEISELAEILNITNSVISLNYNDEDGREIDIPIDKSDEVFNKISLDLAASKLSDNERILIKYRYYEGKTQCECAALLGISQVQVSRREKNILKKLKEYLI